MRCPCSTGPVVMLNSPSHLASHLCLLHCLIKDPLLLHCLIKDSLFGECRTIKDGQYLLLCSKGQAILSPVSNSREISQVGPFLSLVLRHAEGPEARRQPGKCFVSDCISVAFFRNQLGGVFTSHMLWGSHAHSGGLLVCEKAMARAWQTCVPFVTCL